MKSSEILVYVGLFITIVSMFSICFIDLDNICNFFYSSILMLLGVTIGMLTTILAGHSYIDSLFIKKKKNKGDKNE